MFRTNICLEPFSFWSSMFRSYVYRFGTEHKLPNLWCPEYISGLELSLVWFPRLYQVSNCIKKNSNPYKDVSIVLFWLLGRNIFKKNEFLSVYICVSVGTWVGRKFWIGRSWSSSSSRSSIHTSYAHTPKYLPSVVHKYIPREIHSFWKYFGLTAEIRQ